MISIDHQVEVCSFDVIMKITSQLIRETKALCEKADQLPMQLDSRAHKTFRKIMDLILENDNFDVKLDVFCLRMLEI